MVPRGINWYTHRYRSPAGDLFLAVDRQGVVHRASYRDFRELLPQGSWEDNKYACGEVEYQLEQYFSGKRDQFSLALHMEGTEFQHAVWQAMQKLSYGSTITYGELARKIGRRDAARAVGNAVGRNPIAVIVPCHRVVPAAGGTGNYATRTIPAQQGRRAKQHLIALEQKQARSGKIPPP
ncbi:methylated-DNA-[protein]-cysteine S-methyltransferase [Alkalispirochaeta americana]|uniref:methylated-DNA--[protein]-cysteine S-methyltransferase n=1 Tax=Alkalispirochaeta americana TaxID=159291 RepID=A0A1N6RBJ4_9SPIO|nr:methylated-DNA--[protein]-cysteine S-methyltransferase [Alkalispirochaeta americana]SIQ26175.1 methylated-DNA-[protein]-cysteine S-methyltransferase [Alkalispirochaeta americana]